MANIHSDCLVNGKKKALLVAVEDNTVRGFAKLYNAQRDAQKLRRLLIEVFGYSEDNIVLMMDHKSIPQVLWPTKENIRKQLHLFVQGVSTGDHLFFYYSGHGHQVPCNHHTEPDGLDEEIYTCNGKEIMDNDLKKWLVDPLPRGCKLFALWDSCHSQTILDLDHYDCNEPGVGQRMRKCRESSPPSTFWRVLPKRFRRKGIPPTPRGALTIASPELRGRPAYRAPVSITAVSAGSSPPLSKWIPFCVEIQRVLSPRPWFKCNGICSLPTEDDTNCAHVISLAACKDNETAVDDHYNGTVTTFFIDHLRSKPKSTLRELLLAIRERVDEITAARQAWDVETRVISRQATFASGSRIKVKTEWTPHCVRRNTEVNVGTLEELLLQSTPSRIQEDDENKYSQQPSYSSHYPLNLDELVDL